MYSSMGRLSIPPAKLIRAMLLQTAYSIDPERQLMDQLEFDLLFRGFVGISFGDVIWEHATFSKSRDRLLKSDVRPNC